MSHPESAQSNPPLAEGDRYISEEEAGEVTLLGYRRLQSRRLRGGDCPPHYNLNPGLVYLLSECVAWRDAHRVDNPGARAPTPR